MVIITRAYKEYIHAQAGNVSDQEIEKSEERPGLDITS